MVNWKLRIIRLNNNPKWNISILVIFVLLASSLIGILTMNFVKQMVSYTNDMNSYNKSYYYAKAGLELALVEINNAGIWFANHIWSGDDIFVDNFSCSTCNFDVDIQGKTQYLSEKFWLNTGCSDENAFVLSGWESIALPLFVQKNIISNNDLFSSWISYDNQLLKYIGDIRFENTQDFVWEFNLGLIVLLDNVVQRDLLFVKSLDWSRDMIENYFESYFGYYWDEALDNEEYLAYLLITNVEDDLASFCLSINDLNVGWLDKDMYLSTTKFFVSSIAGFLHKTVGLTAIYGQPIPWFLLNTYAK